MSQLTLLSSHHDLAAWIDAALAASPPSLARTVTLILPSHRVAHQVRRRACLGGAAGRVAGVRMPRVENLARDVLAHAAIPVDPSLADLRPAALRGLFVAGALNTLELRYFRADALAAGRGYADAIASTIEEIEGAGHDPASLRAVADKWESGGDDGDDIAPSRLRDLAALWEAVDADLTSRRSVLRSVSATMAEAARLLADNPTLAASYGEIVAVITGRPSAVHLDFIRALRPHAAAYLIGRPERAAGKKVLATVATALGGAQSPKTLALPDPPREIDLTHRYLFATPDELAARGRPRSTGPDGTVTLEQYPGIQHEIGAAVTWVMEEITERRTPLEEIALIVPAHDPIAAMVTAALERCDKGAEANAVGPRSGEPTPAIPAHVAGGLPLVDHASGVLLLILLRALHGLLAAERVIPLLPHLRLQGAEGLRLFEADAQALVYGCGIVGGSPGNPDRATEWPLRMRRRADALSRQILKMDDAAAAQQEDEPEKVRWALSRGDTIATRDLLSAVLPAVEALTTVGTAVAHGTSLAALWPMIEAFVRAHCRLQPRPPDFLDGLKDAVAPACATTIGERLCGREAIDYLEATLRSLRISHGRFGEPRVFVGTAADATGLTFTAVRMLGVVEGAVPPTPHEDPILPDADRARVGAILGLPLERSTDRVLRATHVAFLAATAGRDRLCLSAPSRWIDGTDRELSGMLLEVAAALGRPDPSGTQTKTIPSISTFRRLYVEAGTRARLDADLRSPALARVVLEAATAQGSRAAVPASWLGPASIPGTSPTATDLLSLSRIRAIASEGEAETLSLSDGILGPLGADLAVAGLRPDKTISASGLRTLLECPHRFLLERVLYLQPPGAAPSMHRIDQPYYGSLVHRVMQAFFTAHGAAFCRRERTLDAWQKEAAALAHEEFRDFEETYPLAGDGAIGDQRARVVRDVQHLIRAEWEEYRDLTFHAVEQPFGYDAPVALPLDGGRALHVAGFIDRLDRRAAGLVVRDIKTGRPKPLGDDPVDFGLDVQLAVYAMAAASAAGLSSLQVQRAAYVYPSAAGESERGFEGADLVDLLSRSREWLGGAAELLEARSFPRAIDGTRCTYCGFRAVCGDGAHERSLRKHGASPAPPGAAALLRLQRAVEHDDGA